MALYSPRKSIRKSRGVIEAAGFDSAVSMTPRDLNFTNDYLNFLGEYETTCESALARESGPLGGLFYEKTRW
jgi:hypothetical protein